jgi:hypothetical protein
VEAVSVAHYVVGSLLVLCCICQLAGFATGGTMSRRRQALNLVTMLLLALIVLLGTPH